MSIYYNYTKKGDGSTILKMINIDLIETICSLIIEFDIINTHTSIISLGLLNKLIKYNSGSDRNLELEKKIYKVIIESSLKEKLEYLLINGKIQVITQLLHRNIEAIDLILRGNDDEIEMEY